MAEELLGLADRTVVVAGAGGGGIGTAVCELLGRAGARVAALDIDEERLAIAGTALRRIGAKHLTAVCDVRDRGAVEAAFERAVDELGPLHGLVHVAGGMQSDQWQPTATVDPSVFDDVVRLNLGGALLTIQATTRRLLAQGQGGAIVLVSSLCGSTASPFSAGYGVAKAGVDSLVRTGSVEWGSDGIRINAVAPGTIRTPKTMEGGDTAADDDLDRHTIPLGRRGRPEDIAGAAVFLLSELAVYLSGQIIAVDGASSAKPSYLEPNGLPVFVRSPELRSRLVGEH